MRLLLVSLLLAASAAPTLADAPAISFRNGGPRVRPNDSRTATLLRTGLSRSPTLRALVDRIEDGQVIVYLEMQPRLRAHLSGCLTWVTAAGAFRYVRASISPDLTIDQQIAAIGHELRHVLEIVDDPGVVSELSLVALYRRIGHQRAANIKDWDTEAAQDAGRIVRRELAQMPAASAEARGPISPVEWHAYYQHEKARSQAADAGARRTALRTRFEF